MRRPSGAENALTVPVCVAKRRNILGEGPCWDERRGRLWWFDIKARLLEWIEPGGAAGRTELPVMGSAMAPRADGSLVVASEAGFGVLDPESGDFIHRIVIEPDRPHNRSNDGGVDLQGRFWLGTMDDRETERSGALYRLDPDWTCTRVLDGMGIPNAIDPAPDGRILYVADSRDAVVFAHALDPETGELTPGPEFVHTRGEAGSPDGLAVDEEGCLWSAQWGLWRLVRYCPDGTIDRLIRMPVEQPSSCAFGGDGLTTLYVTSARVGLSDEALAAQPLAGSLFAIETGIRGLRLPPFAG